VAGRAQSCQHIAVRTGWWRIIGFLPLLGIGLH